jgi:GDPmannose 4,6-dehydratase
MYLMLQQDKPRDYVLAMNEAYSVQEFAERAFAAVDLDYRDYVEVDSRFMRPAEVDYLLGDPGDTLETLNWKPRTSFDQLVKEMVEADLKLAKQERVMLDAGVAGALKGIGNE